MSTLRVVDSFTTTEEIMSKFEIDDPELRRVILDETGHMRLINEQSYAIARAIHAYIIKHVNRSQYSDADIYLDCFGQFFNAAVGEYDPRQASFIDGLILQIAPVIENNHLNTEQKARILYACGNLFEMNRILIDIANALHRGEDNVDGAGD